MLIDRIWRQQPGEFFCISTKSASGKWKDNFFAKEDLRNVDAFVRENRDKDIWFCPHGFSKDRRLKPYATPGKLLWADLDEADPREMKPRPTVAIESSPGRYVGLWVLEDTMSEELNRRLTYGIKADVSGWDFTQVLRVPGTTNYKYDSKPRVKILWADGPSYTSKQITRALPEVEDDVDLGLDGEGSDAAEVFKRYEKKLPHWLRKELVSGKPTPGKRSEMLWKLGQTLIEAGLTRGEAFVLLKSSPWNKFKGRRNEDEQLKRELEKSINKHFKAASAPKEEGYKFLTTSMAEVEEEDIDWIWYPYLARGELSILEGDPGLGKSYLAQIIAGHIADGRELPTVKKQGRVSGKIAYFDIENSAGSVTKKRLLENGIENLGAYFQDEQPFSIDDAERLQEVYDAIEDLRPTLVVFDTLNTYIGKADVHKSSESQQAMAVFKDIANRFHCAVLVLRHLTKGNKDKALYRGQGSIAFAGLARVVMSVGQHPEDEDVRVMAVTKLNIGKKPKALTFTIKGLPDTLKSKDRSKFEFGEFVELTADEILAAPTTKGEAKDSAVDFLRGLLEEEGEIESARIEKMAEARSIAKRTLHRAAEELEVKKTVRGFGKQKVSLWSLP